MINVLLININFQFKDSVGQSFIAGMIACDET